MSHAIIRGKIQDMFKFGWDWLLSILSLIFNQCSSVNISSRLLQEARSVRRTTKW